ncbi:hypothetical protein NGB36_05095 [Streptomyces sp. RB6PN25]|uniref:Uncharacterized protein n=1 Tax=Streptomyces humicola TaxID=2953240 RepID=A0ABT1PQM7_9ACTN|nr:hypothetical protein [Streptomyces humicola]MCQ4079982.1 hypothetical protein [Streptomyces humicola]
MHSNVIGSLVLSGMHAAFVHSIAHGVTPAALAAAPAAAIADAPDAAAAYNVTPDAAAAYVVRPSDFAPSLTCAGSPRSHTPPASR